MTPTRIGLAGLAVAALLAAAPALAAQPSDAWITTKVKMSLLTADQIDGTDINVDTFDGAVTLHGAVASAGEKTRAEERARSIGGVKDVRNLLAVVPEERRESTQAGDEDLEGRVSNVLTRDAALEGSEIEVKSVNDGIVVLHGEAETLSAHRRALEDARSVDGVARVESEIQSPDELADEEIWYDGAAGAEPPAKMTALASDAWITTQAKVRLMAEPGIAPTAINVDTRAGTVTLFGSVATEEIKNRAETQIAKIGGVKGVENELQVVPDVAAERVDARDEDILASVKERLGERESLSDSDIDVEVSAATVRLSGTVASQDDRLTALTVARGTARVDAVIDDLRVVRAN